jgi:hypothetical protein
MREHKKFIVLSFIFLFLTISYMIIESFHSCECENCQICMQIQSIKENFKQVIPFSPFFFSFILLFITTNFSKIKSFKKFFTLVDLKTMMNT